MMFGNLIRKFLIALLCKVVVCEIGCGERTLDRFLDIADLRVVYSDPPDLPEGWIRVNKQYQYWKGLEVYGYGQTTVQETATVLRSKIAYCISDDLNSNTPAITVKQAIRIARKTIRNRFQLKTSKTPIQGDDVKPVVYIQNNTAILAYLLDMSIKGRENRGRSYHISINANTREVFRAFESTRYETACTCKTFNPNFLRAVPDFHRPLEMTGFKGGNLKTGYFTYGRGKWSRRKLEVNCREGCLQDCPDEFDTCKSADFCLHERNEPIKDKRCRDSIPKSCKDKSLCKRCSNCSMVCKDPSDCKQCSLEDPLFIVVNMSHFPIIRTKCLPENTGESELYDALFFVKEYKKMMNETFNFSFDTEKVKEIQIFIDPKLTQGKGSNVKYQNDGRIMRVTIKKIDSIKSAVPTVIGHELGHIAEQLVSSKDMGRPETRAIIESFCDISGIVFRTHMNRPDPPDYRYRSDAMEVEGLRFINDPTLDGKSVDCARELRTKPSTLCDGHLTGGVFNKGMFNVISKRGWDINKAFQVFLKAAKQFELKEDNFEEELCNFISSIGTMNKNNLAAAKTNAEDFIAAFAEVGVICGYTTIMDEKDRKILIRKEGCPHGMFSCLEKRSLTTNCEGDETEFKVKFTNCFEVKKAKLAWNAAQADCKLDRRHLLELDDNFDNDKCLITNEEISDKEFWIGGTNIKTEDEWIWKSSGNAVVNDKRKVATSQGGNCIFMQVKNNKVTLGSDDCLKKKSYICQLSTC